MIHILKALEKGFQNMYGFGGQGQLQKKIWPAHENWSAIFDRISARIGTISRVPSTGPTTQTCSVNNFFVTSAFLNLNSSCESRDQELQNDPFSIFMIGASSTVKISSQDGTRQSKIGILAPSARAHAHRNGKSCSRGPFCDEIFTMLEAPIIKIEKGSFCSS